MPWALFNRPSIQLGSLKSYLDYNSHFDTDIYHPYVHLAQVVGTELYYKISVNGWAGEAIFAALLYPEKKAACKKLFVDSLKNEITPLPDYDKLLSDVEQSFSAYLQHIDISKYKLIGFSICFSQLTPSLYLAQKIKDLFPQTCILFGGSSCSGDVGKSLLNHYPFIDYLISGEGEGQLLELCSYLSEKRSDLPSTIYCQHQDAKTDQTVNVQDLNSLPPPDYTPYFTEVKRTFPDQPFIPVIPIEFSRGCWWNKCSFCNLNLQWHNYRYKESKRMVQETLYLTKKHESLHFAFTDNALPPQEADQFFTEIASQNIDFDFFAEIRSITKPERLRLYSQGGLKTAQVGIEALSSSLLKKMTKGTTVMDNIAVMKICCENNIQLEGNLIINYPSTTEDEISETLTHLDFVLPFAPLQTARFFLGYGSPMHKQPADHGITAVLPHEKYRLLFPKETSKSMTMLLNSYRGDKQHQKKLWKPVTAKAMSWHLFHKTKSDKKLLSYRDGGNFIIIRQSRPVNTPLLHRLRGISRKIYLFCQSPKKIEDILANFPKVSEQAFRTFLHEMTQKRLMYTEHDRVLSLAVREHSIIYNKS